jgi:predicted DCC family thiol-disulfide oxidoreductase YuxK
MNKLFVLYDANCEFCRRCRLWLEEQPAYLEMKFIPANSEEARRTIPEVEQFGPGSELTVVSDDGAVYQGPNAFIICLYALVEFREWSIRLARPGLLPFARQTFDFISKNRTAFSRWLGRSTDDQLAATLQKYPPLLCGNKTMSCLLTAKQAVDYSK